jgi:hypothetical protein
MAAATSSLPVPLSPVMSTVVSVGATFRITSKIARMLGWRPTMPAKPVSLSTPSMDAPPCLARDSKTHTGCGVPGG